MMACPNQVNQEGNRRLMEWEIEAAKSVVAPYTHNATYQSAVSCVLYMAVYDVEQYTIVYYLNITICLKKSQCIFKSWEK